MNEKKLKVSVIITTHKRDPEIVERAITSVAMQTYENIEIILVDDSPADFPMREAVRQMAENYPHKPVTYIAHEACKGACAARNTGLAAAKGEFVAFLDDDDEWLQNKVECQLAKFENEQIGLVYARSYVMNDTTGEIHASEIEKKKGFVYEDLIKTNFIGSTSVPMMRTKYLREIGGFDVQMQSAQDYDVWLRMSQKYEVNYCNDLLVQYHIHGGVRISTNHKKRIAGQERIIKKNYDYLRSNKKVLGVKRIRLAPEYAGDQQLGKALWLWCSGVIMRPNAPKKNLQSLKKIFMMYRAGKQTKAKD